MKLHEDGIPANAMGDGSAIQTVDPPLKKKKTILSYKVFRRQNLSK